jgi:hypothetical protein
MSELTHFYSYATGVSLELPAGFTRVAEDEASASYAALGDDDRLGPDTPALQIRVVDTVPADDPDGTATVARLADQLAASGRVLGRVDRTVDECPVVTVEVEREGAYLHLSAVAADGRLLSLAGRGPRTGFEIWDTAIESMRFITL